MIAIVGSNNSPNNVRIPDGVIDLASFRRWAETDDFPSEGWLSHLKGDLWVDLSMETLAHNTVKTCVSSTLYLRVVSLKLGRLQSDRMRLSHPEAELSSEPDAMFISTQSLQRQRVQFVKGDRSLEAVGSPDMVLEVVSDSSEEKDTVLLPELYFKAGIQEYWLVDPRGEELRFDIFHLGARRYEATRKRSGWLKSTVFNCSFRLTSHESDLGLPEFSLEIR